MPENFPIIELRQYTLKPGERDTLIELFEREFIESQEALGARVYGTFRDLDRPDRFVWIRGFYDMDARAKALNAFYFGPVWQAHREQANATMIDSDNVFLLRAPDCSAELTISGARPPLGVNAPAGLVVAVIDHLNVTAGEVVSTFERKVKPRLEAAGIPVIGWFTPETAPNNFPRLPVREKESVLVWFAQFTDERDHAAHEPAIQSASAALDKWLSGPAEVLRLSPTGRSLLRGAIRDGGRDFDFLHGQWFVKHQKLVEHGRNEWREFTGTADTRPLLGGLCNVEEHQMPGKDSSGVALRCFDRSLNQWQIYWVSSRDGILQPPVHGGFRGQLGHFVGDDTFEGRPIKVRFQWNRTSTEDAHWEQAFSFDGGNSWETNWIMDFSRNPQRAAGKNVRTGCDARR